MRISVQSTQYVWVPVTASIPGQTYDPTTDPIYMAFTATPATPTTGFNPANWQTVNGNHYALCLVGPANGGIQLAEGDWYVWVKITDNPEVPILAALGLLTIIP